jgi:hypothetical protein
MKSLCAIVLALCSVVSAQAYTCDDVRALSAEQKAHYIKIFNITAAQQDRIRQSCYASRSPRVHPVADVSDERSTGHVARDARGGQ